MPLQDYINYIFPSKFAYITLCYQILNVFENKPGSCKLRGSSLLKQLLKLREEQFCHYVINKNNDNKNGVANCAKTSHSRSRDVTGTFVEGSLSNGY